MLFSILLGLFSVVKGSARSIFLVTSTLLEMLKASKHRLALALLVFLAFNLTALGCVLWTLLKLYHMLHCETRLWNFEGCVPPEALHT